MWVILTGSMRREGEMRDENAFYTLINIRINRTERNIFSKESKEESKGNKNNEELKSVTKIFQPKKMSLR